MAAPRFDSMWAWVEPDRTAFAPGLFVKLINSYLKRRRDLWIRVLESRRGLRLGPSSWISARRCTGLKPTPSISVGIRPLLGGNRLPLFLSLFLCDFFFLLRFISGWSPCAGESPHALVDAAVTRPSTLGNRRSWCLVASPTKDSWTISPCMILVSSPFSPERFLCFLCSNFALFHARLGQKPFEILDLGRWFVTTTPILPVPPSPAHSRIKREIRGEWADILWRGRGLRRYRWSSKSVGQKETNYWGIDRVIV